MTNLNVLSKFDKTFSPIKTIADSTAWCMGQKQKLLKRLNEVQEFLATRGVLSREERTLLTEERDEIKRKLIVDDPAFVSNFAFDAWMKNEGLLASGFSINENRSMNKMRLNRLFAENDKKIVITSRGNKMKGFFIMDKLAYTLYRAKTFHDVNKETVSNRADELKVLLEETKEEYDLDPVFISEVKSPIRITAGRHENEVAEKVEIRRVMLEHQELIEQEQIKVIAAGSTVKTGSE